ncbi:hypothetical protein T492DRAFT_926224 [Pavlovales sp. CCMP2436]|nr:hypothetical protein T492DRAFT_926224 [Pavlovales sp. CCMP2436]
MLPTPAASKAVEPVPAAQPEMPPTSPEEMAAEPAATAQPEVPPTPPEEMTAAAEQSTSIVAAKPAAEVVPAEVVAAEQPTPSIATAEPVAAAEIVAAEQPTPSIIAAEPVAKSIVKPKEHEDDKTTMVTDDEHETVDSAAKLPDDRTANLLPTDEVLEHLTVLDDVDGNKTANVPMEDTAANIFNSPVPKRKVDQMNDLEATEHTTKVPILEKAENEVGTVV